MPYTSIMFPQPDKTGWNAYIHSPKSTLNITQNWEKTPTKQETKLSNYQWKKFRVTLTVEADKQSEQTIVEWHFNGLVQDCHISIGNTLSCTKPTIYDFRTFKSVCEIVFAEITDHRSRVKMIHHRPTVYTCRPVMLWWSKTHECITDRRATRLDSLPSPTQFLPRSGPRSMGKVAHC